MDKLIGLSFDIEEFDVPLEGGCNITFDEQIRVSTVGAMKILDLLQRQGIKATFFCTVNFAEHSPQVFRRIVDEGHEIASHGCFHSNFDVSHLALSRQRLSQLSGSDVKGYRMARMMPIDESEVQKAGYLYNSSLNPTLIPGRYNNLNQPKTMFMNSGVVQIPTSVAPIVPVPLFWLALHNFPLPIYKAMLLAAARRRGSAVIYFHPWEFYELKTIKKTYSLSSIMTRNSGTQLVKRLENVIQSLKRNNCQFVTMTQLAEKYKFQTEALS